MVRKRFQLRTELVYRRRRGLQFREHAPSPPVNPDASVDYRIKPLQQGLGLAQRGASVVEGRGHD